ncbi:hypothetical protein LJ753_16665 [Arthrobacter sp. zg-Y20]|uniref:hypothetical protein n=1 Tax=unclassified Arthrobacter TaxID=235627 RepID=UPI001D141F8B|nr:MULTISPECIES: hypothetical protein [unclassified Arthrobacter]MCC3277498.1 hypothetical protein [Arthrobacter sp. zg-Y20]MDK1317658.1 hypothetical protein [Arthrobacter sp. zg.Y20]WIB07082.1 hypothetical protein QNO06_04960 [Arthrobacter sp. zg-Y20]
MALEWVRLDTNIASNKKILALMAEKKGKETAFTYACSIAYVGLQESNGIIPKAALPFVHGTPTDAANLVKHGLWDEHEEGWILRNWAERNPTKEAVEQTRTAKTQGAKRGNCKRWHGEDCWQNGQCTSSHN